MRLHGAESKELKAKQEKELNDVKDYSREKLQMSKKSS
jgi:hypothetical protein